jgi:ankyrin repeat protein
VNAVENHGNSVLMIACDRNDSETVTLLLEKKAAVYFVNKERRTALHIAAAGLRRKIVQALLLTKPEVSASSAGVDLRGVEVNGLDGSGRTPLMLAADNQGFVPDEVMELLLNKGAQVDLQDPQGDTALMIAAKAGSMSGVQFLLTKGASVNSKNNQGQTALKLARVIHENKKLYNAALVEERIVEMLVKAGAKE